MKWYNRRIDIVNCVYVSALYINLIDKQCTDFLLFMLSFSTLKEAYILAS